MSEDTVVKLVLPGTFTDQLTEILRSGARALLTQAVENLRFCQFGGIVKNNRDAFKHGSEKDSH